MGKDLRQISKDTWTSDSNSIEHINCGSFQRIADGVEKMAQSYEGLISACDYYKRAYERANKEITTLQKSKAALKGQITKLKRRTP